MLNTTSWRIGFVYRYLAVLWLAVLLPCACSHRLSPHFTASPDGQLTMSQTLGLAVSLPIDSPMNYYFARGDPKALPCLFALLEETSLEKHHPIIIEIIGYIGDKEHDVLLDQWRVQACRRPLSMVKWRALDASIYAQGQLCRRDVGESRYRIEEMLTEQYWTSMGVRLDDAVKIETENVHDQLRATAIMAYALTPGVDVSRICDEFLTSLSNDTRRERIAPRLLPERLTAYVSFIAKQEQIAPSDRSTSITNFENAYKAQAFYKCDKCQESGSNHK